MKRVCQVGILVFSFCVFASTSLGQQPNNGGAGALLSLRANVTPASILELASGSTNAEVLDSNSTTARSVRVTLQNPDVADLIKETELGTLFMTRIEIFVRFSGFKEETATVLISVADIENSISAEAIREGVDEKNFRITPGQIIRIEGVRSGARMVRYVGFLVERNDLVATQKTHLKAVVTYEIAHP